MNLLLNIKKGDIISVVGSFGKTTLINTLKNQLNGKVLVTTTTKIGVNQIKCDYYFEGVKGLEKAYKMKENGTYLVVYKQNGEKLEGFNEEILNKYTKNFDYILIEADGSKQKPLKGWASYEPVIISKTTKTVGLINFSLIGEEICEKNIHRADLFCKITNSNIGDKLKVQHIKKVIVNENGLFKNAVGEKIVLFNRINNNDIKYIQDFKLQSMVVKWI